MCMLSVFKLSPFFVSVVAMVHVSILLHFNHGLMFCFLMTHVCSYQHMEEHLEPACTDTVNVEILKHVVCMCVLVFGCVSDSLWEDVCVCVFVVVVVNIYSKPDVD